MAKIDKICETCGNTFQADTREINRGNAKYCSLSCAGKAPKSRKYKLICQHCGQTFTSSSSDSKYCSSHCKQKNYRAKRRNSTQTLPDKQLYSIFNGIACELCAWDKASRDLHHIVEVSNGGVNSIDNVICVCPNCHRMIHSNLISKDDLLKAVKDRTISSPS